MGAVLVLLEHVAANPSTNRGFSLTAHLINTMTLLACLALTAWWAAGKPALRIRADRRGWPESARRRSPALGVSGVIAALGDTLFPARSLAEGFAQDLDPAANIFLRLRLLHPVIAAAAGVWLAIYAAGWCGRDPNARPYAWALLGILAAANGCRGEQPPASRPGADPDGSPAAGGPAVDLAGPVAAVTLARTE